MKKLSRVLLVDDNPADIDLTRDVLARGDYPSLVCSVADGEEAMAFLQREGRYADKLVPDLVLLDLNLPRKDGRAVLAEVKSHPTLHSTPVVIFSTSQASQDIDKSYELGANSYVCKPGNLHDYVAAIDSIGEFWFGCARFPREEES
jgi:chemotaxis family two-component system response regulator Rcp1